MTTTDVVHVVTGADSVVHVIGVPDIVHVVPDDYRGADGAPGPPGPLGGFVQHLQVAPAATWSITHSLPHPPMVVVLDQTGHEIELDIAYATGLVVLTASEPISGSAYLYN